MYDPMDIPPPQGVPERWLKLLRRTHEVGSRIAQTVRKTIDHGREQLDMHARNAGLGDAQGQAGYRPIEPTDG
jgi:hypothetical protein